MAAADEGTPSAPAFNSEDVTKLMGKGKRHYVCNEITEAVKCFEVACESLGKHYGETANECGDAYLYYGKALLDLARLENNPIGSALQDAAEKDPSDIDIEEGLNQENFEIKEMTKEQKEEVLKNVIDAMIANKTNAEEKAEKPVEGEGKAAVENKDASSKEKKEIVEKSQESSKEEAKKETSDKEKQTIEQSAKETDTTEKEGSKEGDKDIKEGDKDIKDIKEGDEESKGDEGNKEDDGNEGGDDEEGEDDEDGGDQEMNDEGEEQSEGAEDKEEPTEVSNIQLAWEILELARVIFERQEGKEADLHSAQCHLKLGEIKMEQEQFEDAIADLVKCLELQRKHLESDDRLLAETLYNIGLCHSYLSKFDKAKDSFNEALNVIKLRIDNLEKRVAEADSKSKGKGKADATDPVVIDRKELKELNELCPEIRAKVDDANEMLISGGSLVKAELGGETTNGFGASSSNDKPATLIAVKKAPKDKVSDISHLVKKVSKRKPEEENKDSSENGEVQPAKKPRQETNGVTEKAAVNGTENATAPMET